MSNNAPSNKSHKSRYVAFGAVSALSLLALGGQAASANSVVVKPGDTVWGIANQYSTTKDALENANPHTITKLSNSVDLIQAGQQLVLPNGTAQAFQTADEHVSSYVVKSGDTLSAIAKKFGVTVKQLMAWNHLTNADQLKVGQVLIVDGNDLDASVTANSTVDQTSAQVSSTAVASSAPVSAVASAVQVASTAPAQSVATSQAAASAAPVSAVSTQASAATQSVTSQPTSAAGNQAVTTSQSATTNSVAYQPQGQSQKSNSQAPTQTATTTQTVSQTQAPSQTTYTTQSLNTADYTANTAAELNTSDFVAYDLQPTATTTAQSSAASQAPISQAPASSAATSSADNQTSQTPASVTSSAVVQSAAPAQSQASQSSQVSQSAQPSNNNGQVNWVNDNSQTTTNTNQSTDTSVVSLAVKLANSNIPYVWGGASLSGMDCSGLVDYVYAHAAGKQLPHNTVALESYVNQKPVSQAQAGDLLFWGNHGATYHTAIYIGNNQYVAAPNYGQNVQVQSISRYFEPSFAGTVK